MTDEQLIEQARFAISRYDHYYETVNSKGNLYLTINSILIGGIATSYSFVEQKMHFGLGHNLTLILIIILCASSLGFTIAAINPFTRTNHQSGSLSLLFYGQVAQYNYQFFSKRFRKRSAALHLQDMLQQMHILAQGLSVKFERLKVAGWLLSFALMVLILFTLFLILKN